jgi:hypothetical protein
VNLTGKLGWRTLAVMRDQKLAAEGHEPELSDFRAFVGKINAKKRRKPRKLKTKLLNEKITAPLVGRVDDQLHYNQDIATLPGRRAWGRLPDLPRAVAPRFQPARVAGVDRDQVEVPGRPCRV